MDPDTRNGEKGNFWKVGSDEEGIAGWLKLLLLPHSRRQQPWRCRRHLGVMLLGILLVGSIVHSYRMIHTTPPVEVPKIVEPTFSPIPRRIANCGDATSFVNQGKYVTLVDETTKFLLVGTPKGGATLSTQLMFRYLNLTDTAMEYSKWIHDYRSQIFVQQPLHKPRTCEVCYENYWTCLKLVRSPFDRIVSSYIHVMRTKLGDTFEELHEITTTPQKTYLNATFADFISALFLRNKTNHSQLSQDTHFMPQADWGGNMGCDDAVFFGNATTNNTTLPYWIPIEAIHDGLKEFHSQTGIRLDATNFSSHHYVSQQNNDISMVYRNYFQNVLKEYSNVSSWPPRKTDMIGKIVTPPYEAYFDNSTLNQVFCQLFCRDIDLYLYSVCHQPWLTFQSGHVQQLCHREQERVKIICEGE